MFEDKHTEFKSEFSDEIKKTVVAFANTDGGTLYINTPQTAAPHGAAVFCHSSLDSEALLIHLSNMSIVWSIVAFVP